VYRVQRRHNKIPVGATWGSPPQLFGRGAIAPIAPMESAPMWTVEQSPLGVSIGKEHFTDLDYADDVALLAEMLKKIGSRTVGTTG